MSGYLILPETFSLQVEIQAICGKKVQLEQFGKQEIEHIGELTSA